MGFPDVMQAPVRQVGLSSPSAELPQAEGVGLKMGGRNLAIPKPQRASPITRFGLKTTACGIFGSLVLHPWIQPTVGKVKGGVFIDVYFLPCP